MDTTIKMDEILAELKGIRSAAEIRAKDILTLDEAVVFCGFSLDYMRRRVQKKEIRHYRRGNRIYFEKSDLEKWMTSNPVAARDDIRKAAALYTATHKHF